MIAYPLALVMESLSLFTHPSCRMDLLTDVTYLQNCKDSKSLAEKYIALTFFRLFLF